jgi:hypothetical protein
MREPRDEEHQFSRLVARIRRTVTEFHARSLERLRASLDDGTNGFGGRASAYGFGGCRRPSGFGGCRRANGFASGMG